MEEGLTKKEKRALAKEDKKRETSKDNFTKYLKYAVFSLMVISVGYLLFKPSGPRDSSALNDRFVEYAQSLGLNTEQFRNDLGSSSLSTRVLSDLSEATTNGFNSTPTFVLNGERIPNPDGFEGFKSIIEEKLASGESADVEVRENDHTKGSSEAGVVLIEYSDFQCPACAYYAPVVNQLSNVFPEDLLIVYRHFPLQSIHSNAKGAAVAAEAAALQGKFWEYHDILFEKQVEWARL